VSDDLAFETVDVESALFSEYRRVQATVFLGPLPTDQDLERVRRTADRATRRVAALDRHRIVGTYVSWDSHVTAPGGRLVAADAVSGVTVLPTHRRRGVLTRMIVPDLAAAASRGVPVAILIAAEAPIYGRFGFGAATETARWTVDLRAATLTPQVVQEGSAELLPEAEMRPLAPAVFEAARRPGAIDHNDRWWDRTFGLAEEPDHKPRTWLVHRGDDGTPDGYAGFRAEESWVDREVHTVAHVEHFQAATPAAYAGLWSVLTSLDLVARVSGPELAVDEPLPWLLTDHRAARLSARQDHQWSRLLDPAAALSARTYETTGAVTFAVVDPQGWAEGVYRLETDADGTGGCTRVDAPADLTISVGVLSSLWLGGGSLHAAALGGLVAEHAAGAVDRLARLLHTTRAPWTPTWF
jgi:predicted acetyltransferase